MFIVFDIGGSHMRIGASRDQKTILQSTKIATPKIFEEGLQQLISSAEALAAGEKIEAIAGGIAGLVDESKNEIIASTNLHDWENKSLANRLNEYFKCSVAMENDAAVGALGEAVYGAGKNYERVAYIAIGTGLGGSWVVNGKLQNNQRTFEPGHQFISYETGKDLEKMIITEESQEKREKYLAVGLSNILMLWPSEIIILGGGKILHHSWSIDNIKYYIRDLNPAYQFEVNILTAALGDEAGLYGALTILGS